MTVSGPIEVAAFEAANSRAYLKAVFAAWAEGRTVMALPEGAGRKTVPGTLIARRDAFASDPGWFDAELPAAESDARALIAFSSGTTGRPKAILLRHRALQDVVARINGAMEVTSDIREYLGVPVTYSFGFGRARAVAAAGGRAFIPEYGFDPSEIGRMLSRGEINAVSAVPTLWRVLLANQDSISGDARRALRWIEIGSQWMTGAEKLALRQVFPNARIVQHYGLTEASRTTLLDVSEAPAEQLDSVGRATGEVEVTVDDEGRILIRGPHLAEGMVSGAGVKPVVGEDGWLTTSDLGRIEDGWLFYEGRADELINSGGLKIDPTAFEQSVNAELGRPGAVAAGRLPDDLRGEKLLVTFVAGSGVDRAKVEAAVAGQVANIGLTGKGAYEIREIPEIPLTSTGKVKRAELAGLDEVRAPEPVPPASAPAGGKAAGLQALWAEILGLDSVPMDQSFYDLGGDSLSALTAIMRMESLGIDLETARGIFEGRTIAEMAEEAPEPVPPAPAPAGGKAAGLQALWAEILGLDTVPLDRSFYDLGGDSLSALTAIMRMESLGIDLETARGIFEGRTIADLTDSGEATSQTPTASAPEIVLLATGDDAKRPASPILTFAETISSVHAARGLLVWWVVVVHWLPALLERLGENFVWIYDALEPALRFGTPGFAMVFGVGVGALGIHHYQSNRALFRKSTRFNTKLIVAGVIILAIAKFAIALAEGTHGDPITQSGLFYSAITYYALAMLTLPLIMRVLMIGSNRLLTMMIVAIGAAFVNEVLEATIGQAKPGAILEFLKILATSKYGYFRMTGFVIIGVAIGWLFRRYHDTPEITRDMALYGVSLAALGLVGVVQTRSETPGADFDYVYVWHQSVYAGVALLILSGFASLNRAGGVKRQPLRWLNSFAIASGILALPIFVGHEIIWALKQLSDALGIPETMGLLTVLGLFFGSLFVAYRRLMKYF